jgi:hypothetical protein
MNHQNLKKQLKTQCRRHIRKQSNLRRIAAGSPIGTSEILRHGRQFEVEIGIVAERIVGEPAGSVAGIACIPVGCPVATERGPRWSPLDVAGFQGSCHTFEGRRWRKAAARALWQLGIEEGDLRAGQEA